ncbi:hypothetical protein N8E87_10270 [Avibacterium paragallinarum]|uniref:ankyrin repeat domain-containing protein n=1 Tax=Avibacterium paragallinarum TaxID=728 RepID=UPI0021F707B1|nr:hypothetical protein [Avibacterium paragallinarum]UXN36540.1 hypothetical protein N8E87_10270 [Avibacterium paragallinarum]
MKNKWKFIKKIIYLVIFLGGCMNVVKNETEKNKRFPAEDYFYGDRLEMGKAIYENDISKVEMLLKQGKEVNELSINNDGFTYLMYSVFLDNRIEIIRLLFRYGADPHLVSNVYFPKYKSNLYYLPLTFASSNESIEYVKLLLENGADPNYFYKDSTGRIALNAMPAINAAVRSAYILNKWDRKDFMNDIKARIELLLEYGADINSIGAMGKTVVEWANSNTEIVLYLMDKGADHRLYGKKMLKRVKNTLRANPNDEEAKEIIRRLTALGYE